MTAQPSWLERGDDDAGTDGAGEHGAARGNRPVYERKTAIHLWRKSPVRGIMRVSVALPQGRRERKGEKNPEVCPPGRRVGPHGAHQSKGAKWRRSAAGPTIPVFVTSDIEVGTRPPTSG